MAARYVCIFKCSRWQPIMSVLVSVLDGSMLCLYLRVLYTANRYVCSYKCSRWHPVMSLLVSVPDGITLFFCTCKCSRWQPVMQPTSKLTPRRRKLPSGAFWTGWKEAGRAGKHVEIQKRMILEVRMSKTFLPAFVARIAVEDLVRAVRGHGVEVW